VLGFSGHGAATVWRPYEQNPGPALRERCSEWGTQEGAQELA
jgi:hypothetical protein